MAHIQVPRVCWHLCYCIFTGLGTSPRSLHCAHLQCTAQTSPERTLVFLLCFTLSLNGCCFRCCTAAGSAGSHPQKGYCKYFRFNLGLISVLDMLTFFISTVFQKGCLGGYLILWRLLVGSMSRFSRPVAADCVSRQARHSVPC